MTTDFPYEDIINLSPHISNKHPQASIADRAARFSPFAAITGYEDMVNEAARFTDKRMELDDNVIEILNTKLTQIRATINSTPLVSITHFVSDEKKSGGTYITSSGHVNRINDYLHHITFDSGEQIHIKDIIEISILTDSYK